MISPNRPNVPKILVVEDEQIIALNLRECVEALGYQVPAISASAKAAVEAANRHHPDLVLMDIRLKGKLDGIKAAEQIWNTLHIPVIYITGHSDSSTLERVKATVPFGYILKPVNEKELYVAIEMALHRHQHEQWLHAVFNTLHDGIIVADIHNRVKLLNPVAETLTGWTQSAAHDHLLSEVFRLTNSQFLPPGEMAPIDRCIEIALQQPPFSSTQPLHLLSPRQLIPIALSITTVNDHQGRSSGIVMVFRQRLDSVEDAPDSKVEPESRDETDPRTPSPFSEQQLHQLKVDFLSTTSHELRTPLTNIKMAIHMLQLVLNQQGMSQQRTSSGGQPVAHYLEILEQQCEQELRLINDLLELRSLDADPVPLQVSIINLPNWLPTILQEFADRAQSRQQQFEIQVPSDLPSLSTEAPSLARILAELVTNACKHTPIGQSIKIIAQSIEPNQQAPPCLQISVCNSGAEIPDESVSHIFDPFYRIPSHDPWRQGGTGLGLALVKKLVHRLHGRIKVTSNPEWTSFAVQLPWNLSQS